MKNFLRRPVLIRLGIALVVLDFLLFWLLARDFGQYLEKEQKVAKSFTEILGLEMDTLYEKKTISVQPVHNKQDTFFIYKGIQLVSSEKLPSGLNPKSLIISKDGNRIYSMNLEGMSVSEFDRKSKKLLRTLVFDKTEGKGYDYDTKKFISSFEEKPVEACLTHNDRYLWVSLHNAAGVAVWDLQNNDSFKSDTLFKNAKVKIGDSTTKVKLKFLKTGKTPKVITASSDNKYLFVSNWHNNNVTVIELSKRHEAWKKKTDLPVGAIPRGMVVSEDNDLLYVALMGSNRLTVFSLDSLKKVEDLVVGSTPRHLVFFKDTLFVSLSSPEQLVKVVPTNRKNPVVAKASTKDDPRTIALSPKNNLIFVGCYEDCSLLAYRTDSLTKVGEWKTSGKAIGLATWQYGDTLETWVCNYSNSVINVFKFKMLEDTLYQKTPPIAHTIEDNHAVSESISFVK